MQKPGTVWTRTEFFAEEHQDEIHDKGRGIPAICFLRTLKEERQESASTPFIALQFPGEGSGSDSDRFQQDQHIPYRCRTWLNLPEAKQPRNEFKVAISTIWWR